MMRAAQPSRMCRHDRPVRSHTGPRSGCGARRGLAPQMLARAVEDSGTVTSPLVAWDTYAAYTSGVSTVSYLPFCFVNLLSPVLDVLYGFLGFRSRPSQSWRRPSR